MLLPVCRADGQALDALTVRAEVAAMRDTLTPGNTQLVSLAQVRRAAAGELRGKLSPVLARDLDQLRFAPVLINSDGGTATQPLTRIRQSERGVGDHALTIFDTQETFAFDQSHIFFDGILGSALAEIMTNEALSWAVYLNTLPPSQAASRPLFTRLELPVTQADRLLIQTAPRVTPEAVAESDGISLRSVATLRRLFRQRNDQIDLTVNDLLLLYRAIHAVRYQPSADLLRELDGLSRSNPALAASVHAALDEDRRTNPSILIPIDASRRVPRDRLYPLSLEVPLAELDLIARHDQTLEALVAYETAMGDRAHPYEVFDQRQRAYLASLAGLGMILSRWKALAVQGESPSVGAIKLLSNLPPALQKMLDSVPARFEMLNNMLKGREVFSNVGAVVPTSTLSRFVTAKDDNEQKQLVWAILTDAGGVMHISLRDFRPHVAALQLAGQSHLADRITQDYLDAYVNGFNAFVRDLKRITVASRHTRFTAQKVQ